MRNKKKIIVLLLLFFLGLAIFIYPTVSDMWNRKRAQDLIGHYQLIAASKTGNDRYAEDLAKIKAYNKSLIGSLVPDVFAKYVDQKDANYEALLNVTGDGMMGYVNIPSINVQLPIYHYTTEEILQENVGHLHGSSLPIGGVNTHAVLSAHRGLPSAKLFSDLNLLQEGDYFFLKVLDREMAYSVDKIEVVEPQQTETLSIVPGEDYVTLFTCTPYGVNTHRLLVRGKRTQMPSEQKIKALHVYEKKQPDEERLRNQLISIGLGIVFAMIIVFVVDAVQEKVKRKQNVGKKEQE